MTTPGRRRLAAPARRRATACLILATVLTLASCRGSPTEPTVVLRTETGSVAVRVEIARTREEVSRGLMWRDRMDADAGMLFVFDAPGPRTFWMKNTPLPLDIVFIDEALRVLNVAEATTPYSESPIRSAGPARYVLEVNAGFVRRHGIGPGTRVELPQTPSAAAGR